jgi:hypothetical protein
VAWGTNLSACHSKYQSIKWILASFDSNQKEENDKIKILSLKGKAIFNKIIFAHPPFPSVNN